MHLFRLVALVLAATLAAPAAAAPGSWIAAIRTTPGGGHAMGNPDAEVKLVEYLSYTCPHCAEFHKESDGPLRLAYVMPGKVSVEVRHFVRDPVDMTAALLTNCGEPKSFFKNHAAFLSSQPQWIAKLGRASAATKQRWTSGPMAARFRAIASDLGFYKLMEPRGLGRPALDRCLADEAMARRLAAQTAAAEELGLAGTPGFLLDGLPLSGTYDWTSLELQIKARL